MNFLLLLLALTLLFCPLSATASASQQDLRFDGETRHYRLYVPPSHSDRSKLPLLLVLHGRNGDGQRMAALSGFDARAERFGFVVAYPDGLDGTWNYLHGLPGAPPGADDVGFLLALVDRIAGDYRVDRGRIFVAGISNGGFMAQRLACDGRAVVTGFASVAAGAYAALGDSCAQSRPVDALYLHGTADRLLPWEGLVVEDAEGSRQTVTWSVQKTLEFWARHNGCAAEVDVDGIEPGGRSPQTRVQIIASTQCRKNARVRLYAVIGGGHNWPGVPGFIPEPVAGRVNLDIHASDVIWSFFDHSPP